jgi:GAF domain-containing protein
MLLVRLAWTLLVLTALLAVAQIAILVRATTPLFSGETFDDGFPVVTLAAVVASTLGALIVTRYPSHRIGWLFLVGQFGTMVGLTTQAYGYSAQSDGWGSRTIAQVAMWVGIQAGGAFAVAIVALLLLLVPDGRLMSPRWRWATGAVVAGLVLHVVALSTVPPGDLTAEGALRERERHDFAVITELVATALIAVGLIAAAVSLFLRLRRAAGVERTQLRWIAAAAVGLALGIPIDLVIELAFDFDPWVEVMPLMVSYLCLSLFTGVAILRHHLYGMDVLLNRSIVLSVLTGFAAVGYVAVVLLLGELDDLSAGESFWPALLATAVVALAFHRLRRMVNRMADRLVYGARAVPYEALASFIDELRSIGEPTETLPRMAEAVGRAVGARAAIVWIDVPGGEPNRACWPQESSLEPDVVVPVMDEGELLGGLGVSMAPGRGLRTDEERLLADLATQLAKSFRSSRLKAELATRVEELARQSEQLETSSRRLISAESAERRRFEHAIAREVIPHLESMPDELARLGSRRQPWPSDLIQQYVDRTDLALDSLRRLTRGVFPAQLAGRGLVPALSSHLKVTGIDGALEADDSVTRRRFPPQVESVAYFCAVELVRELIGPVRLAVDADDRRLTLVATGAARTPLEMEADSLRDRAEAVGGALRIAELGSQVQVAVELPAGSPADALPGTPQQAGVEH